MLLLKILQSIINVISNSQIKETVQDVNQVVLSDWLSYLVTFFSALVGALGGALATMLSVRITLRANQKQYHQDLINRTLPFFVMRQYKNKRKYNLYLLPTEDGFSDAQQSGQVQESNNEETFKEYLLDSVCLTRKDGQQSFTTDFSKEQWAMIENGGFYVERNSDASLSFLGHRMLFLHCAFENVGNGTASIIRLGLNKMDAEPRYIIIPAKKVGEEFHFRFLIQDYSPDDLGNYYFDVVYMDIYQRVYRQRYKFVIEKTTDEEYRIRIDLGTKQEEFESFDEFRKRNENGNKNETD